MNDVKISKKGLIIIAVSALLIISALAFFIMMNTGGGGVSSKNSNIRGELGENYTGEENITLSQDVKAESLNLENQQRKEAGESEVTRVPQIPVDKDPISSDLIEGKSLEDLMNLDIPCVDTDYDDEGFHCITGFDRQGYDKNGMDINGFNRQGCDSSGKNRRGENCKPKIMFSENTDNECLNRLLKAECDPEALKYNDQGYDEKGLDKQGFDKQGYGVKGFDRQGYSKNGFNISGYDRSERDRLGFNEEGFNRDGFNKKGYF
jgi:hypothetical protein